MPNTADDARKLADLFSESWKAIDAYRTQHFAELSSDQRKNLDQSIQKIEDAHDECTADAIEATLQQMHSDLEQIGKVTGEAQQALKHLNTIQEVVNIASALSEVAAAIMSSDYAGLTVGIADLTQAVSKKSDGSDDAPAANNE